LWRFREFNDVVAAYYVNSDSDVAVVGSSTIFGKAKIAGMRWVHPFAGSPTYSQTATVGFDYKNFAQTNISAQTGIIDPLPGISYVPLTAGYSGTYSTADLAAQVAVSISGAPRGLFGNNDSEFEGRRALARASYSVLRFDSFLDYRFAERWGAYGKITGQWTNDPLIANEQFSIGGVPTVRGYLEAELLGDRGISGQFELRFHPWGRGTASLEQGFYALAFADYGEVRIIDPLGPQVASQTIASIGLGARLEWRRLRFLASVGHALRNGGSGLTGPLTASGSNRWNVLLGYGL
jgi:hemolysin activation/secretion protein